MNRDSQKGFTLIELIIVVAILGILAVTLIPKYIDLRSDARDAAVEGVAGALGSGSAINFAARTVDGAKGVAVANCTDVSNVVQGGLPTGYTITAAVIAAGVAVTCTVNGPGTPTPTATFTGLGIA